MKRGLRIAVSVGLLVLLARWVGEPGRLWLLMRRLTLSAAVAVLLLNTLDRGLMTWKWLRLLARRGHHLGLFQGIQLYCASTLWGLFLPSTMGADTLRAACTVRAGLPAGEVIASIAVERIIGVVATPLLAMGGLVLLRALGALDPRLIPVWWASFGLLSAGILALTISLSERFHRLLHGKLLGRWQQRRLFALLERSHETFREYRKHRSDLAVFFGLTVLENLFPIVIAGALARAIDAAAPPLLLAAAVPLAYLVSRIPFSIAGIGVFESVFTLVLAAGGVPREDCLAIALLARVLQIAAWLPWGFTYVARGGRPGAGISSAARLGHAPAAARGAAQNPPDHAAPTRGGGSPSGAGPDESSRVS